MHASSTMVTYSPLGEHLGTTVKLGPLARSVSCDSVRGEDERLTTHLASVLFSAMVLLLLVDVGVVVLDVIVVLVNSVVVALSVDVW